MNIINYYKSEVSFFGVIGRHGLKQRPSLVSLFAFLSSFAVLLFTSKPDFYLLILIVVVPILIVLLLNMYMKSRFINVSGISLGKGKSWREEYKTWASGKMISYLSKNEVDIVTTVDLLDKVIDDKKPKLLELFNTALLFGGIAGIWGATVESELKDLNTSGKIIFTIGLLGGSVLVFQIRYILNEIVNRRNLIALELRSLLLEIALDPESLKKSSGNSG